MTVATSMLALVLVAAGQSVPSAGTDRPVRAIHIKDCMVTLIEDVQVPAREPGVLTAIQVRLGAAVEAGSILASIDDSEAKLRQKAAEYQLQVAKVQAESNATVDAAIATTGVAKAEYDKALEVNKGLANTYSQHEVRRMKLMYDKSGYQTDVARLEKDVAQLTMGVKDAELQAVQHEIELRQVRAPLDGVIYQRLHDVGEWVAAGEPIFRLVRMNRLRVEGLLNADDVLPEEIAGHEVTIHVPVKQGVSRELKGVVDFVSPIVDGSGHFLVFAEFDNPRQADGFWPVRPGLEAEMTIELQEPVHAPVRARQ